MVEIGGCFRCKDSAEADRDVGEAFDLSKVLVVI